ncbi:MAG TPA: helix-turn-helix domain-containing protein, partial [Gaiellaceae bacterium]|nr:helix-turn-helix domain-containing protein [Gaiellaceae bacterium]
MAAETGTQAIERAAQLLVRVVEAPQPPSIGELSERSGLPKSTTSRLIGALERQGLVQRLGSRGQLRPGPVLLRYASRDASQALVALAQPSLKRLADESGETINLAVPGPAGVEHLAQEDTAHLVGVTDWVGRRVPFELAANGKCFLAFGGGEVDDAELIRSRGYATSIDELEVGLSALSAPVLDAD